MAIIHSPTTTFDQSLFDKLWDESLEAITGTGKYASVEATFDWTSYDNFLGHISTTEEKKEWIKETYIMELLDPNAFCFKATKDDIPIMWVTAVKVVEGSDTILKTIHTLLGCDASGSRSWYYNDKAELRVAWHTFLVENGITKWVELFDTTTSLVTRQKTRAAENTSNNPIVTLDSGVKATVRLISETEKSESVLLQELVYEVSTF